MGFFIKRKRGPGGNQSLSVRQMKRPNIFYVSFKTKKQKPFSKTSFVSNIDRPIECFIKREQKTQPAHIIVKEDGPFYGALPYGREWLCIVSHNISFATWWIRK